MLTMRCIPSSGMWNGVEEGVVDMRCIVRYDALYRLLIGASVMKYVLLGLIILSVNAFACDDTYRVDCELQEVRKQEALDSIARSNESMADSLRALEWDSMRMDVN
jgi:hypothetical protein